MKKRVLLIIGLIVLIAGVIISNFAKFPLADVLGYAITMFGAGLAGVAEDTVKTIITAVFGLVVIIAGLIVPVVIPKNKKANN